MEDEGDRADEVRPDVRRAWGRFIKRWLKESGLTPYGFAKRCRIAPPRVYDVINDVRAATWGQVQRVADEFGVKTPDLFNALERESVREEERPSVQVEGDAEGFADPATADALASTSGADDPEPRKPAASPLAPERPGSRR